MGGTGRAGAVVRRAIESGKHVVTANKALIASQGAALEALADAYGVSLRYEAAVGGAIPLIHTLRGTLMANRITRIRGILNGTTNFMHGIPHFAISIGLERDGEIVAGVVYEPTRDELYWA